MSIMMKTNKLSKIKVVYAKTQVDYPICLLQSHIGDSLTPEYADVEC